LLDSKPVTGSPASVARKGPRRDSDKCAIVYPPAKGTIQAT
jgi:hypothetical protein